MAFHTKAWNVCRYRVCSKADSEFLLNSISSHSDGGFTLWMNLERNSLTVAWQDHIPNLSL